MNIIFEDDASHISQCCIFFFISNESKNVIITYLSHEKSCMCQKGHAELRFRLRINSGVWFYSAMSR